MNNYKFMQLIKVVKNKLSRAREKQKDLEVLVNTNAASNVQKQEYIELKAKIEAYEDVIDLAEGIIEDQK